VFPLSATLALLFLLNPILEVPDRIAADTELYEMKRHPLLLL
jgi:hypothetical protein